MDGADHYRHSIVNIAQPHPYPCVQLKAMDKSNKTWLDTKYNAYWCLGYLALQWGEEVDNEQ